MYTRSALIQNETGLHARPASEFVACAGQYESAIHIRRKDEEDLADAKSIIMLLSLALEKGAEIEIRAEGEDESQAVEALVALLNSKFGEN